MKFSRFATATLLISAPAITFAQTDLSSMTSGIKDKVKQEYTQKCLGIAESLEFTDTRVTALCESDPTSCSEVIKSQGIEEQQFIDLCETYSKKAMGAVSGALTMPKR